MRKDFNKLLVENPRPGSRNRKFGNTRHNKTAQFDDEVGGKVSMRFRHHVTGDVKDFNENLSPLIRWVESKVNKPWNDSYSELRQTFDARGVINAHILQHLFDFVNVHTKVVDGEVLLLNGYSGSGGYVRLEDYNSYRTHSFYVCPKTGNLKHAKFIKSYRQVQSQRMADRAQARAKVFRVLSDTQHLHKIDDTWFVCDIAEVADAVDVHLVKDVLTGEPIYGRISPYSLKAREFVGVGKYYCKKRTASRQLLKEVGVI